MKLRFLKIILFATTISILPGMANAQNPIPPPNDPNDAPIDGGLSVLLAAGVAYGVKKGYNKRKKDKDIVKKDLSK